MHCYLELLRSLKSALRNRFHYVLVGILVALPIGILHAQTNPYRYGSPHYWMAQSTLHITDGKFDMAYEDVLRQEYSMAEHHLRQCWEAMQDLPFMEREQAKLSYYKNMVSLYNQRKNYGEAIGYARKYVEQSK